jgi:hypothetical protein
MRKEFSPFFKTKSKTRADYTYIQKNQDRSEFSQIEAG